MKHIITCGLLLLPNLCFAQEIRKPVKLEIEPEAYVIAGKETIPKYVGSIFLTRPVKEGSNFALNAHTYWTYDKEIWYMFVAGACYNSEHLKLGAYGGYESTADHMRGGVWTWWSSKNERLVLAATYENGASGYWLKADIWYKLAHEEKPLIFSIGALTEENWIGPGLMLTLKKHYSFFAVPAWDWAEENPGFLAGVRFVELSARIGRRN